MKPADVETFFRLLTKDREIPRTELEYINPYTLLVAVVLSAQATDVSVNKATEPLFKLVDTPQKMVALGEARLQGLHQDDRPLQHQGQERHRAEPDAGREIRRRGAERRAKRSRRCPGVGRKTANVVLNVAFGEPTIAVDTHIFRVGNRTGLAPRQDAARGRGQAGEGRAEEIHAARASLADPARPLYLQRAQAEMPGMPGAPGLRIQGEIDARRFRRWRSRNRPLEAKRGVSINARAQGNARIFSAEPSCGAA